MKKVSNPPPPTEKTGCRPAPPPCPPRKKREYKVVKDSDLDRLVEFINKLIQIGWSPYGGVSSCGGNGWGEEIYFLQAMVKEKF